jgi:hypothetical protein
MVCPALIAADSAPLQRYSAIKSADASVKCSTEFASVRDQVSAPEWQTRTDLAACYRLVDCYAMTDLIYNHITARISGADQLNDQSLRSAIERRSRRRTWSRSTSKATSSASWIPIAASMFPAM